MNLYILIPLIWLLCGFVPFVIELITQYRAGLPITVSDLAHIPLFAAFGPFSGYVILKSWMEDHWHKTVFQKKQ